MYVGTLRDQGGVYLHCANECVEIKVAIPWPDREPEIFVQHKAGGIFLPSDSGVGAKIFFYKDSLSPANRAKKEDFRAVGLDGAATPLIVNAIISYGDGNIFFPKGILGDMSVRSSLRESAQ